MPPPTHHPKPPAPVGKPLMIPQGKPSPVKAHVAKTFEVKPWTDSTDGMSCVIYGKSGIGKTTLAAQLEGAVFIGLDDGGRKIANPITGKPINAIPGITGFQDVRDALHQRNLFHEKSVVVIDTVTKLESVSEPYIFQNYKLGKGETATSMRKFGWDGPAHLLDVFRLLLTDLDEHKRMGHSVVLLAQLAQITVANAEGLDYLEDGPKLQHNKQYSVRTELCEWADHVFRIGYSNMVTELDTDKARVAKVQSEDASRGIFTGGAPHFIAKAKPIGGKHLPPLISYTGPSDNSLWQMIFEGAIPTEAA